MPAPYRLELRRRIVRAYDNEEGSVRALAKRFAVAPNTLQNYLNLRRKTGGLAPRAHGGGRKPRVDPQLLKEVRRLTYEMPDATLAELAQVFAARYHVEVSRQTMARALQRAQRAG
jgi:putative transposase